MSLRIDAGGSMRYCDGLCRRSFVQLGVAGMASLGLGDILRAKALSASSVTGQRSPSKRSVILIWLDGGPSHLDMYDMKPEAADRNPRHLAADPHERPRHRDQRTLSQAGPRSPTSSPSCARWPHRHGRPFRRRPPHAHGQRTSASTAPSSRAASRRSARSSLASSGARIAAACRPTSPCRSPPASGSSPATSAATGWAAQYDPFQTGGDPNGATFRVENLDLAPA